ATRKNVASVLLMIVLAGCGSESGNATLEASFSAPDFVVNGESFLAVVNTAPNGGSETYDWSVTGGPSGSNPNVTPNGDSASIVLDLTGQYTVNLKITDSDGQSANTSKQVISFPPGEGPVVTTLDINSVEAISETALSVPVTFGQLFAKGDVPDNYTISGRLEDGSLVPIQVDAKSWYADGSLKHAVLTSVIPSLQGGEQLSLELMSCAEYEPLAPVEISDLQSDSDATVSITIGENTYTASLRHGMDLRAPSYWLRGPVVTEAHYQSPFLDANDNAHPLLTARFQLRVHQTGDARIDVIVENSAAFVPGARNLVYTAEIVAAGATVMPAEQIPHNHHSRWRKTFWLGAEPRLTLGHDVGYLISTGAIPNFDRNIAIDPSALEQLESRWETKVGQHTNIPAKNIMGAGLAAENMWMAGGRSDIGLLPAWTALHLLTMDNRAIKATYGTADAAAHWPIHFRDSATGLPLSLEDYPGATTHSNVAHFASNPLPECVDCETGFSPDTAHQPSMVFVPYLLTGDYYYLEELHFWTNWNSFGTAPELRSFGRAEYRWQQVRGQAWSMRTLLQTVFITPDAHPMKSYFQTQLDNNFDFYITEYVNNPEANELGWIGPLLRRSGPSQISPWMDDFFTMIMNYARHLGFERAVPILDWKLQFALKRMGNSTYCWQFATTYRILARAGETGDLFTNMADAYIPTLQFLGPYSDNWEAISQAECGSSAMASAAGFDGAGEFAGFPANAGGYPAALRPVIAAALERDRQGAQIAWQRLLNAPRVPGFDKNPAFAILPR
ncbi:MAG: PKD domain-containing protein, partial [Gammaproteobacteria bacterium]|nr:PKD domain-containing protein [Gammaproteobacteria bacterium]